MDLDNSFNAQLVIYSYAQELNYYYDHNYLIQMYNKSHAPGQVHDIFFPAGILPSIIVLVTTTVIELLSKFHSQPLSHWVNTISLTIVHRKAMKNG